MKTNCKKLMALALAFVMVLGMLPSFTLTAHARSTARSEEEVIAAADAAGAMDFYNEALSMTYGECQDNDSFEFVVEWFKDTKDLVFDDSAAPTYTWTNGEDSIFVTMDAEGNVVSVTDDLLFASKVTFLPVSTALSEEEVIDAADAAGVVDFFCEALTQTFGEFQGEESFLDIVGWYKENLEFVFDGSAAPVYTWGNGLSDISVTMDAKGNVLFITDTTEKKSGYVFLPDNYTLDDVKQFVAEDGTECMSLYDPYNEAFLTAEDIAEFLDTLTDVLDVGREAEPQEGADCQWDIFMEDGTVLYLYVYSEHSEPDEGGYCENCGLKVAYIIDDIYGFLNESDEFTCIYITDSDGAVVADAEDGAWYSLLGELEGSTVQPNEDKSVWGIDCEGVLYYLYLLDEHTDEDEDYFCDFCGLECDEGSEAPEVIFMDGWELEYTLSTDENNPTEIDYAWSVYVDIQDTCTFEIWVWDSDEGTELVNVVDATYTGDWMSAEELTEEEEFITFYESVDYVVKVSFDGETYTYYITGTAEAPSAYGEFTNCTNPEHFGHFGCYAAYTDEEEGVTYGYFDLFIGDEFSTRYEGCDMSDEMWAGFEGELEAGVVLWTDEEGFCGGVCEDATYTLPEPPTASGTLEGECEEEHESHGGIYKIEDGMACYDIFYADGEYAGMSMGVGIQEMMDAGLLNEEPEVGQVFSIEWHELGFPEPTGICEGMTYNLTGDDPAAELKDIINGLEAGCVWILDDSDEKVATGKDDVLAYLDDLNIESAEPKPYVLDAYIVVADGVEYSVYYRSVGHDTEGTTCSYCGAALGGGHTHSWNDGYCSGCNTTCNHNSATTGTCLTCGKTLGNGGNTHTHSWLDGYCSGCNTTCNHNSATTGTCATCGKTLGNGGNTHTHTYGETGAARYTCTVCSAVDEARKAFWEERDAKYAMEKKLAEAFGDKVLINEKGVTFYITSEPDGSLNYYMMYMVSSNGESRADMDGFNITEKNGVYTLEGEFRFLIGVTIVIDGNTVTVKGCEDAFEAGETLNGTYKLPNFVSAVMNLVDDLYITVPANTYFENANVDFATDESYVTTYTTGRGHTMDIDLYVWEKDADLKATAEEDAAASEGAGKITYTTINGINAAYYVAQEGYYETLNVIYELDGKYAELVIFCTGSSNMDKALDIAKTAVIVDPNAANLKKLAAALGNEKYVQDNDTTLTVKTEKVDGDEMYFLSFTTTDGEEQSFPFTFYKIVEEKSNTWVLTGMDECAAEKSVITVAVGNGGTVTVTVKGFPNDPDHGDKTVLNGVYTVPAQKDPVPDAVVKNEEKIEVPEKNEVVNITAEIKTNDLSAAVAGDLEKALKVTKEEKAQGVWVWMELTEVSAKEVDAKDSAKIENALGDKTVGTYMDISVFKQVVGGDKQKVGELGEAVTIAVVVPENLRKEGRTFSIVYVHGDAAPVEVKAESYNNANGVLTFKADKFSTYALAYTDKPVEPAPTEPNKSPATGEQTNVLLASIVFVSALAVCLFLIVTTKSYIGKYAR